jgi:poly-gamma-glutamate synthesis protein (capsule biosynthesis protein)
MVNRERPSRRLLLPLILTAVGLGLLALMACDGAYEFDVTATPTRTPRPTATPVPPTPTPTPTPAWPLTLYVAPEVPAGVRAALDQALTEEAGWFAAASDAALADVQVTVGNSEGTTLGTWVYALVAPFPTLTDGVAWTDVLAAWSGQPTGQAFPFAGRPLLMDGRTQAALTVALGPAADGAVMVVPADELVDTAWADGASWGIVPFHELDPRLKVLRVDDVSVLDKGLAVNGYPLAVDLDAAGVERGVAKLTELLDPPLTNRDEEKMTVVVMTGVTALTRGTGQVMNRLGATFPAQDIGPWLRSADLTHISNEVSFTPDCPLVLPEGTMVFCSREEYIGLLEAVGTDIVELTGNHNNDYGVGPNLHTLQLFRERGWRWFGGGEDLEDATRPLTVTVGPNRLAFLGCNAVGPQYGFATEDTPGAAPCDWEAMASRVALLRAEGWLPIVTVQAYETYEYFPTPGQETAFRAIAEAGAVIVQGSQAHQPQGFDFASGAFVHYGLGNLFFDQMWSLATRQEFVDRHVFYDGRHISVELLTAMLEDYARPRPMTVAERRELLDATFSVSGWVTD